MQLRVSNLSPETGEDDLRNLFQPFGRLDKVYVAMDRITRESPTQALYHLDERLGFVAAIETATLEAPYVIPVGHHIVAGHYVLRVEA